MSSDAGRPTGLTRDAGWELGVRRTAPVPLEEAWDFLLGDGLDLWLGRVALPAARGERFETADGVRGQLRSRTERTRIRMTWHPADLRDPAVLQVTVSPAARGTTIGFHVERLPGPQDRERLLVHFTAVAERIVAALTPAGP